MKIHAALAFAAALLVTRDTAAQTTIPITSPVDSLRSFDNAVTSLMAKYKIPGGQLAVAYQGRLVVNHGYGTAIQGVTTQPETLFRSADLSRPITSAAIMKLVEEGTLSLGTQTSPGHWNVTGTGVVIDPPIFIGPIELHLWDPPLVTDLSIPADHDWDGADGDWDWHGHKTWSVNPLDDGELLSGGYIVYSKKGVFVDVRALEQDSRRRFIDDTGSWHTELRGPFDLAGSAKLTANGKFEADGSGTFKVSATAIPEPAVGLLSGLIAAVLAARARVGGAGVIVAVVLKPQLRCTADRIQG